MTPEIVAVLVVGDEGWLLAPGRCGGEPPKVCGRPEHGWVTWDSLWRTVLGRGRDAETGVERAVREDWPRALPLWWDGRLCEEGWDRLTRVMHPDANGSPLEEHPDRAPNDLWYQRAHAACYHRLYPTLEMVDALARVTVAAGHASRVVRLARVDGRLVEVSDYGDVRSEGGAR